MNALPGWEGVLLLLGATLIVVLLIRATLGRAGLPALLGYLLLGFGLRLADEPLPLLSEEAHTAYHFLARLGLFALLFKVGLTSNVAGLLKQLRRAVAVWCGDVLVSGAVGLAAGFFLLGLNAIPSLVVAAALTATSVGVSVAVWQSAGVLDSPDGRLLTDVAELDDMTGVALMAVLSSVLPSLHRGADQAVGLAVASTLGLVLLKIVTMIALCVGFARYAERKITQALFDTLQSPGPMLGVMAIGLLIAAMAALLGLSIAIGAFLAGLAFSRDPQEHRLESSFEGLYEFLSPFFFIGIGMGVDPTAAAGALGCGAVLLSAAIVGKLVGVSLPAWPITSGHGALLLGLSMIPRAEIALVIMHQGREMGEWAVPPEAYAGMVVVSAGTCALAPLVLHPLLRRWKQKGSAA